MSTWLKTVLIRYTTWIALEDELTEQAHIYPKIIPLLLRNNHPPYSPPLKSTRFTPNPSLPITPVFKALVIHIYQLTQLYLQFPCLLWLWLMMVRLTRHQLEITAIYVGLITQWYLQHGTFWLKWKPSVVYVLILFCNADYNGNRTTVYVKRIQ